MANGVIPVVDFGIMGLNSQNPPSLDEESVKLLADTIHTAFSTIGFVYLTNHGISDAEVCIIRLCRVTIGKIANHRYFIFPNQASKVLFSITYSFASNGV